MELASYVVVLLSALVYLIGYTEPLEISLRNERIEKERPFLYKCRAELELESWKVPSQLRMLSADGEKWEYFAEGGFSENVFNFTLRNRTLECSDTFVANMTVETTDRSFEEGGLGLSFNFTPGGHLAYIKGEEEIYFDKENYCIDQLTEEFLSVRFCKSTCFHEEEERGPGLCIPKCCPIGMLMKEMKDEPCSCVESPTDWAPRIYHSLSSSRLSDRSPQFHYVDPSGVTCMNDSIEYRIHSVADLKILSDGRIFTRRPGQTSVLSWEQVFRGQESFCVDGFWQDDPGSTKLFVTTCGMTEESVKQEQELAHRLEIHLLHSKIVWFMIYMPCALIHLTILLVYGALWEKHTTHGWTAMALSASQLLLYSVLLTLVGTVLFDKIDVLVKGPWRPLCAVFGVLHHFAELSCYAWTVVLTFDIWRRFSSLTPWNGLSEGRMRFFLYCCFGLGVPGAIVVIACCMEWLAMDYDGYKIEPGYSNYCTVYGQEAYLAYMGLPNAALFVANLILAFCAFKKGWKMKSIDKKSSKFDKLAFMGKLISLTGIVLVFELIFNFAGLIDISIYFTILESYRLLHALGFFWIFVCNKKIVSLLCSKFPCLRRSTREKGSGLTAADAVSYRRES